MNSNIEWLDEHFTLVEGFPRPNWETINKEIGKRKDEKNENDLWCDIATIWVDKIKSVLSAGYSTFESKNFILLTAGDKNYTSSLLGFLEDTLCRILKTLSGIASDEGYGKHVVLIFDNLDHYYSYISYFYPDEGEFASSGGVYLNKGYGHFVFPHQEIFYAQSIASHELCHALLDHLPLPPWLNEGITVNIENMIMGSKEPLMDHVMINEHKEFWDEVKIQQFWSGESFSRPDDGQHLSYHLAQFLVLSISKEYKLFKDFVLKANYSDGGELAANSVYDNSLGFLIEGLLGKGDWAPNQKLLEETFSNQSVNTDSENSNASGSLHISGEKMDHQRAFLMGATGTVKGRLGWAHQTINQLFDEYEPIISRSNWLQGQEFDCVHYVMRFGESTLDNIEVLKVNKYKELPVASQLSMEELHKVYLDKPKLREYLEKELKRVLVFLKTRYSLSSLPELGI